MKIISSCSGNTIDSIFAWLLSGLREEPSTVKIFQQLCERLLNAGLHISRATLHFRVHHPQWLGARITWCRDEGKTEEQNIAYDVEATASFQRSPFHRVILTGKPIRQSLRIVGPHKYPIYEELRAAGHTDYSAWPLDHTQGRRHLITFSTDRSLGFSENELIVFDTLLPVLSLVTEIRLKNQLARTLLQTYVGPHASEQILDGATTRGSGTTVSAAVMMCDLRNFTELSSTRPRDEVISILNSYFDLLSEPIERHGGEILKFIGDGLLAVFPLENPSACRRLLAAVAQAHNQLASTADRNCDVSFGTGIHLGDVMYGNIGSVRRLDFTVIGPAVNLASRLEGLTKSMQRPVLASGDFVQAANCASSSEFLGMHSINGFYEKVGVFAVNPNVVPAID